MFFIFYCYSLTELTTFYVINSPSASSFKSRVTNYYSSTLCSPLFNIISFVFPFSLSSLPFVLLPLIQYYYPC